MCISSEAEGVDIEPLNECLPVTDADPVLRALHNVIFDDGNVGRCSAHVDDHGIFRVGESTGADRACGGTAQQGLDGALKGKSLRHLGSVAADDRDRDIQLQGAEDFPDRVHKGTDHRHEPRVEKSACAPPDGVSVSKQCVAQYDGYIPVSLEFAYDIPRAQFIGSSVISGIKLNDADAVAVRKKIRNRAAEGLPVGFLRGGGIRKDPAVDQQNV